MVVMFLILVTVQHTRTGTTTLQELPVSGTTCTGTTYVQELTVQKLPVQELPVRQLKPLRNPRGSRQVAKRFLAF